MYSTLRQNDGNVAVVNLRILYHFVQYIEHGVQRGLCVLSQSVSLPDGKQALECLMMTIPETYNVHRALPISE